MKVIFKTNYIGVGNMAPNDIPTYIEQIKNNIKISSELRDLIKQSKNSLFIEELFVPVLDTTGTTVDIQEIQF